MSRYEGGILYFITTSAFVFCLRNSAKLNDLEIQELSTGLNSGILLLSALDIF